MTARPRDRRWGSIVCALLSIVTLASLAPTAARAQPAPPITAQTSLTLLSQNVWIDPNGSVISRVRITGAPVGAQIQTILHTRVRSREDLHASFDQSPSGGYQLWQPPEPIESFPSSSAGSVDATVTIGLSDGTGEAGGRAVITSPGVFPVQIRVLDANDSQLASITTYAVRLPGPTDTDLKPTERIPLRVATVLPLTAPPSRRDDGRLEVNPTARLRAASLVQALEGGEGEAQTPPLALAATPEVLASLTDSTTTGDPALVSDLAAALGTRQVLQGPFVDVQLGAWLADPHLIGHLDGLLTRGVESLTTLVHRPDDTTMWAHIPAVPDDTITAAAVDWLAQHGVRKLLIPQTDVAGPDGLTDMTTQPFVVPSSAGPVSAVVYDSLLRSDFDGGGALAVNRTVADLAQIAFSNPTEARGVVLLPEVDDLDAKALTTLLSDLRDPRHDAVLSAVDLESIFQLPPATVPDGGAPLELQVHSDPPVSTIGHDSLRYDALAGRVADLGRMLGGTNGGVRALHAILDSAGSIQTTPERRGHLLDAVDAQLANTAAQISLPARQTVTLTARDAVIPVTIRNNLPTPATVRLHLDSSQRLEFPDGTTSTIRLNKGTNHLRIRVRTRTPGDAEVRIKLTSPDGALLIGDARYTIHATGLSGVGLIITAGALAVVLLWWIRHGVRSRRERRARHVPPAQLLDLPQDIPHHEDQHGV